MKIVKLNIVILLLGGLISVSWANEECKCPHVNAIQSVGVTYVNIHNGFYAATTYNKYNTNSIWGFGLTNIKAASKADALVKSNTALSTLVFKQGPIISTKLGIAACYYQTIEGYEAVALTTM